MTINGQTQSHEVEPRLLLVHYIRETVGLTGTHVGCDTSQCGACTILMNGQAVKACTVFTVQAEGAKITTIEGSRRTASCTRSSRASGRSTACSAGSARPA